MLERQMSLKYGGIESEAKHSAVMDLDHETQ